MKRLAHPLTSVAPQLLLLFSALSGCDSVSQTYQVTVEVRVSVCVDGNQRCFALPVPEADIEVVNPAGQAVGHGKTNHDGIARLTISSSVTEGRVVGRSPLLESGQTEATLIPSGSGETNITLTHQLSPQAG